MTSDLIHEIRQALADHADPTKAEGMRAYMKSEMPYRGVQKPARTKICRAAFRRHPIADQDAWRDTVLELWRDADYREERYAALDLAGAKQYMEFRTFDRDFFIRKAIGWALRDLAWTDLDTVESYVARNHDSLSPLSRREALKNAAKIRAQTSP